ncbi:MULTISPECIES: hypothetical protein [Methylobacterium]|uniref:Helix-turn-helix domain-containing protein n=2 Tax=Methylobacterium TaxID=407 RepID=A0A0C6FGU6_9HYPH|nr:hypothetical protein [Methylobacterium aquaticum]BAQ44259.1 hypothetical protein Maq22A_c04170 [Methylobacterium aquaticum]
MKGAAAQRATARAPQADLDQRGALDQLATTSAPPQDYVSPPIDRQGAARKVFLWLRQIARHAGLTPLGYRVAIEISQCVDRRKGYAHPSHEMLADALDASRRGIQLAVKQLQDRGHLDVTVSRGAGHANRYRLRLNRATPEAG